MATAIENGYALSSTWVLPKPYKWWWSRTWGWPNSCKNTLVPQTKFGRRFDPASQKSQILCDGLTPKVNKVKFWPTVWPPKSKKSKFGWGFDVNNTKVDFWLRAWPQKSKKSKFGWGFDVKHQKLDFLLRAWPQKSQPTYPGTTSQNQGESINKKLDV